MTDSDVIMIEVWLSGPEVIRSRAVIEFSDTDAISPSKQGGEGAVGLYSGSGRTYGASLAIAAFDVNNTNTVMNNPKKYIMQVILMPLNEPKEKVIF